MTWRSIEAFVSALLVRCWVVEFKPGRWVKESFGRWRRYEEMEAINMDSCFKHLDTNME
jgi:hypothetical protein